MNDQKESFKKLSKFAEKHGYTIGKYVPSNGNCLFTSLKFLGYGRASYLRKALAVLMYEFRDYVGLIENYKDMSIKQIYYMLIEEELPLVMYKNKKIKYTFEVFCHDLSRSKSWERIHPIELLFLTISKFLNVEVVIYTDFKSVIKYKANNKIKYPEIITLGYVDMCHYVPLKPIATL